MEKTTYLVMDLSNYYDKTDCLSELAILFYEQGQFKEYKHFKFSYPTPDKYRKLPEPGFCYLKDAWPEILPFFQKSEYVVCFNAGIHKTTLRESLLRDGLEFPENKYFDILNFARVVLPNLNGWSRFDLANYFNFIAPERGDLEEAHFSAAILDQLLKLYGSESIDEVYKERQIKKKANVESYFKSQTADADLSEVNFNGSGLNPTDFLDKKFVITGNFQRERSEIADTVKENGGIQVTGVSKVVNYLIVGDAPGPSKIAKALELNQAGADIIFISEEDIEYIFY